jgi:hypothetical protein
MRNMDRTRRSRRIPGIHCLCCCVLTIPRTRDANAQEKKGQRQAPWLWGVVGVCGTRHDRPSCPSSERLFYSTSTAATPVSLIHSSSIDGSRSADAPLARTVLVVLLVTHPLVLLHSLAQQDGRCCEQGARSVTTTLVRPSCGEQKGGCGGRKKSTRFSVRGSQSGTS